VFRGAHTATGSGQVPELEGGAYLSRSAVLIADVEGGVERALVCTQRANQVLIAVGDEVPP
jgi:hypothetical protein